MKINKSTVHFNTSISRRPDGSKYTIVNTPYWKLYCKPDGKYSEPYTLRSLTYDEVLSIVNACDTKQVFTAYPRLTKNDHNVLKYEYLPHRKQLVILNKHTGEVLFILDINSKDIIYCTNPQMRSYYKRKFLYKENDEEMLTPLASELICENSRVFTVTFNAVLTEDDIRAMNKCFYDTLSRCMGITDVFNLSIKVN